MLNTRLTHHLAATVGSGGAAPKINTNDGSAIHALPEPLQTKVIEAFADSLHDVFLAALPIVAYGLARIAVCPARAPVRIAKATCTMR